MMGENVRIIASSNDNLSERHRSETAVYDAKARNFLKTCKAEDLLVSPDTYPLPNREHADILPYAIDLLGNVSNKKILECGCGTGTISVFLAKRGAAVWGVDISPEAISAAKIRAEANGIRANIKFELMPVEDLSFPVEMFDYVFGSQVLHHLEIGVAAKEIYRVLRKEGQAIFSEPAMFSSTLIKIRRSKIVERIVPPNRETPMEQPLTVEDIKILRTLFPIVRVKGFQLLSRLDRLLRLSDSMFLRLLQVDSAILRIFPPFKRYCRFVVIQMQK